MIRPHTLVEAGPTVYGLTSAGQTTRFEVIIRDRERHVARYEFRDGEYIVGRSVSSDVVIDSAVVSRRHARLRICDGQCFIEDLGSTNGTLVEGELLTAEHPVASGKTFEIGETLVVTVRALAALTIPRESATGKRVREPVPTTSNRVSLPPAAEVRILVSQPKPADEAKPALIADVPRSVLTLPPAPKVTEPVKQAGPAKIIVAPRAPEPTATRQPAVSSAAAADLVDLKSEKLPPRVAVSPRKPWLKIAAATVLVFGGGFAVSHFLAGSGSAGERFDEAEVSAPALFSEGAALIKQQRFEEALKKVRHAVALAPKEAEYHFVEGNIEQSLLRFADARASYKQTLKLNSKHAPAAENLQLSERLLSDDSGQAGPDAAALLPLHTAMLRQGRLPEALALASRLRDNHLIFQSWNAILAESGLAGTLTAGDSGALELDLSNTPAQDLSSIRGMPVTSIKLVHSEVTDLAPLRGFALKKLDLSRTRVRDLQALKGMPLTSLFLDSTQVADLAPLEGMPLQALRIWSTPVADLAPLRGMPLRELNAGRTQITDLAPLAGMSLEVLHLEGTAVSDLAPLNAMPLRELRIWQTPVADLAPLAGMPLRKLLLYGCPNVRDLTPLAKCEQLERVLIPVQCHEIGFLKKLASLQYLGVEKEGTDADALQTAADFWAKQDAAGAQTSAAGSVPRPPAL